MKKILFVLLTFPLFLNGQVLPDVIEKDTTLYKVNSPFLIPDTLTINEGVTLTIEAGSEINFSSNSIVLVYGNLFANGTVSDSIFFNGLGAGNEWQYINLEKGSVKFSFCSIKGGKRFLNVEGGNNILITNCNIISAATTGSGNDCIAVHRAKYVKINSINLTGQAGVFTEESKHDAIDVDLFDSCFIENCTISYFSDDGLDLGSYSKYAFISNNVISHCNYGISLGEWTPALAKNNIISYNDGGIQVHTNATLVSLNNTLYSNDYGIRCYHYDEDTVSGGNVEVINTIFSGTKNEEYLTQPSSSITISYSLSDKETLEGENNLFADPLFTDPLNNNFKLQSGSPCIASGSPDEAGAKMTIGAIDEIEDITSFISSYNAIEIKFYPNPVNDFLHVERVTSDDLKAKLVITDNSGKVVFEQELYSNAEKINVKKLSAGFYFAHLLYDENKSQVFSIIKK